VKLFQSDAAEIILLHIEGQNFLTTEVNVRPKTRENHLYTNIGITLNYKSIC